MTNYFPGVDGSKRSSKRLNALFRALSSEHRRQVLRYFQTAKDEVATIDGLIDHIIEEGEGGPTRDQLELTFHHVTLPKLADLGVIEYDNRSGSVRYREPPVVERVLTVVTESDLPAE